MEENSETLAATEITKSDAEEYAARHRARQTMKGVLATLLSFFTFTPIVISFFVKFKKKFIVFPILFVISFASVVTGYLGLFVMRKRIDIFGAEKAVAYLDAVAVPAAINTSYRQSSDALERTAKELNNLETALPKAEAICAFIAESENSFDEWRDEYVGMYKNLPSSVGASELKELHITCSDSSYFVDIWGIYDYIDNADSSNMYYDYKAYRVDESVYSDRYNNLGDSPRYEDVASAWEDVRLFLSSAVKSMQEDIAEFAGAPAAFEALGADPDGYTFYDDEFVEKEEEFEAICDIIEDKIHMMERITLYLVWIGVFALFILNIAAVICLGKLGSKATMNEYVIDLEGEVRKWEGKAAQKAFVSDLSRLSKARDYDGFVAAVNSAHERCEAQRKAALERAEAERREAQRKAELAQAEAERRKAELAQAETYSSVNDAPAFVSECDGKSTFDGTLLQRIGWTLLCNIVNVVTLGIAYPATLCMMMRWKARHTLYGGRRLTFDGKGLQLFGKWICWGLLTIITLGIYGFFVAAKIEAWKAKHTHIAGESAELGGTFDGGAFALFGYNLLCGFLSVATFGLALPFALCLKERWLCKHRVYDGKRLVFDGTGRGLFGNYIKWFLLSAVTLGIYSLWIPNRILKWKAEHTTLADGVECAISVK